MSRVAVGLSLARLHRVAVESYERADHDDRDCVFGDEPSKFKRRHAKELGRALDVHQIRWRPVVCHCGTSPPCHGQRRDESLLPTVAIELTVAIDWRDIEGAMWDHSTAWPVGFARQASLRPTRYVLRPQLITATPR